MRNKKITFIFFLGIFFSYGRNADAQSQTFNYTGSVQAWTVPCATTITITATGAQGGDINGGLGAKIIGTFTVTPGNVLDVMVGQLGFNNSANFGGAGGGGSFVWNSANTTLPMVAAGGGGGGVSQCTGEIGGAGSSTTTPTPGAGAGSGAGGTGGNGGVYGTSAASYSTGGGGCGWLTNGGTNPGVFTEGAGGGGFTPLNGGAGGAAGIGPYIGGAGGFGGGGGESGQCGAGGGGGGYNGGGGGDGFSGSVWGSGGGGGSYNGGTNQSNTAGVNTGNGSVTIAWTAVNVPVTCSGVVYQNEQTCNGQTGIAYAVVTGAGLTYAWTGGQTKDTATGLSAGSYTVIVSSACGGSASAAVTITQPPNVVTASTVVNANVLCNGGSNGSATVTINGAGTPYTYTWSPAGGNAATANGLSAGIYTVVVANVCGASASAQVTITQPAALSITATTTANIPCYGDNNGTVLGTAHSGTPPYNYVWAPTGGNLATAVGLAPGVYTVTLTDNNGCTGSARTTVTQPAAALTTAITAITNVLCNPGSTGSISSSTAGGTLPYTYSWTGGQTNAMANALTAGSYTLNITDAHGCKVAAAATVTQPSGVIVTKMVSPDDGACTGSAWVMVNGGVLPYTYLWSNGNTTAYAHDVCGDTAYCCKITDANGCSESACVTVDDDAGVANISSGSGKVTVYPNPTSGQFTIQLSGISSQWSVEVYNVLGEKVYSQFLIPNSSFLINLSNQPNGIYLYRIVSSTNGNMIGQGKIVLEK